jgi:hypothetical protein
MRGKDTKQIKDSKYYNTFRCMVDGMRVIIPWAADHLPF